MAKLPYSRVVNVTLSRNDAFASKRGFGVPLFLTGTAKAGVLDASHRTFLAGSMDEVAAAFSPSDEFYKAALAAFAQEPRPIQIKAGFVTIDVSPTAAELQTQLDTLYDADADWYWITIDAALRDTAQLDGLVTWVQAKNKMAIIGSNDVGHETPANTTCISARHKGTADRTATFYHTDATEYCDIALAAALGTRNFDEADSAYTAKFKSLATIAPINKNSAAVQSITGFTPALGQSLTAGHMANTYIDIGGRFFVVEGSTLTPNVFIDEIHATDWLIARTEEETLNILLNNDRIPYTDAGLETLVSGARQVMRSAFRAGIIANDLDANGNYSPAVRFIIPSVFDVPESQRHARVAPEIQIIFRYAGAVHYTTINLQMTF
ncbi:DUF3383 family protein [Phyllobacterium sp. BT25]|uniref:DUF3383 family protein n=1 Tax=Phyllobacterium pellucidum TaxID=2740464 RepID=A0A849VPA1_9HYPH|nr:DUF3383 family protein [Phyllobacterium pellucidum]NTS31266.1 DUF3383 family protein [Phyllobacterium pellucidum]